MLINGEPARFDQLGALALTNYGHFTSMLVEDFQVRGLSLHLLRLTRDCSQVFGVELDTDRVRYYLRRALREVAQPVVARVTIYDPALELAAIGADSTPQVLITTKPAPRESPRPWRLRTMPYLRDNPEIKHVGLYGPLHRRRAAQRAGFDDALFVDEQGTISEATTANVGFINAGRIIWPRAEYLPGITMALLNQATGRQTGIQPLTVADLVDMEAAFMTNAAVGLRMITGIDDLRWSDAHESLSTLRSHYDAIPAERI